jgi:outer membrane immunogenic protein
VIKALFGAVVACLILAGPASAADMAVKAPPKAVQPISNWTGFYVGANVGYGFSAGSRQISDFNAANVLDIFQTAKPVGGFGGGQIGYNWQLANAPWVLGVEADLQGSGLKGSHTGIGTALALETNTVNVRWFDTFRGRLGYAADRVLLYATGGVAFGNVNSSLSTPGPGTFETAQGTQRGFAVGGGLEYLIAPKWSLKAEYQYIDLGRKALIGIPPFVGFRTLPVDTAFNTVRAGINYHF